MRYFILTIFIALCICCNPDDSDPSLLLLNNSEKRVYFYSSRDYPVLHYPDTLLPPEKPVGFQSVIAGGGTGSLKNPHWGNIYAQLPNGSFSVYVFDADLIDSIPWSEVQANYLVLKRIDAGYEDLKNSNYTIEYNQEN